jgi:hypothetical protein
MAPFDLDACIDRLRDKQLLGEALLREICEKTKEVLMRESNVVHVSSPVTVVGDIHGQFHDLIEIFRIGGDAPNTNYLFLGELLGAGHCQVAGDDAGVSFRQIIEHVLTPQATMWTAGCTLSRPFPSSRASSCDIQSASSSSAATTNRARSLR